MIYKISVDGQKSILNMPAEEADTIELIKKEVGGRLDCAACLNYEMYFDYDKEIEEWTLNTVASQLAEFDVYGDVVLVDIVNYDIAPLTTDDIALINQEIEARKHHKINFTPPDHEIDY